LFWSIVGAILILGVCYVTLLLLEEPSDKPPSGPPTKPSEVAVAVELSEINPPEDPAPPPPKLPEKSSEETPAAPPSATEKREGSEPEELPSLASNVESENPGADSSSLDEKTDASNNAPADSSSELPPSPDSSAQPPVAFDTQVGESVANVSAANPTTPSNPTTAPTHLAPRASSTGQIPAFQHVGEHQEFLEQFPRLEVAWVVDPRSEDPANPRTLLEVVWSPLSKQLAWKNNSTGNSSADFGLVTRLHDTTGRIVSPNPGSMSLWSDREKILDLAGINPASAKILWGYLRHKVEVRQLAAVRQAFVMASSESRITYDPTKSEFVEVCWGMTTMGQLGVVRATFVGDAGKRSDIFVSQP
jgi:hypothetical protein